MDTRRDFLKKAALLSGAGSILGTLPESIQRAFAIDPEPGTTWLDAEHIVILMQENRSFDHSYGSLQGVRGFNDPRAITLPDGKPVWLQTNARNETYAPFRLDLRNSKVTWMGALPHGWSSQEGARNHGRHDHWLQAKPSSKKEYAALPLTLGHFTREDIPFYYALADAFTICDQNFCSSLTGTDPNRVFFWSGTNRDQASHGPAKMENSEFEHEDSANWPTFPERLEDAGLSWKIYQNELSLPVGFNSEEKDWLANFGDNPLEWFSQYPARFLPSHRRHLGELIASLPAKIEALKAQIAAGDSSEQTRKELKKAESSLASAKADWEKWSPEAFAQLSPRARNLYEKAFCTNSGDPDYHALTDFQYTADGIQRTMKVPKGDILHQFRKDADSGALPAVSWLVAPRNFSDHPDTAWYGAWYVSEVLEILTKNPERWKKTIFILTYDENDGYFDHVPPFVPPHPQQAGSGAVSGGIDAHADYVIPAQDHAGGQESPVGLGFRVPLVIASPWSRGGYVCSQVFDHTSTLQLLERFASHKTGRKVAESNISPWRRTVCGDLTSAFRPYHGEKIALPKPVEQKPFFQAIHESKFKVIPANGPPLSPQGIAAFLQGMSSGHRQEPGVRPACALPYELAVDGEFHAEKGVFEISLEVKNGAFGEKAAGAPFTVYALRGYTAAAPDAAAGWETLRNWAFAVAAGERLQYAWPVKEFDGAIYHLRVYGPNGFHREFRGNAGEPRLKVNLLQPQIRERPNGLVELALSNLSPRESYTVAVVDLSYGTPASTREIRPGERLVLRAGSPSTKGWYDLAVTVQGSENFLRRYAGRVETGEASISDPLMGRATT